MNDGTGNCGLNCLFWLSEVNIEVAFVVEVTEADEDATNNEVEEKKGIVEFADCWPEKTKLAEVVVIAGEGVLVGISIGSSVVV